MLRTALFLLPALLTLAPFARAEMHIVESPDSAIEVFFEVRNGSPFYWVKRFGEELVHPSRLGFTLVSARPLSTGFEETSVARNSVDTTWTQPWGECREVRDAHNELRIDLRQRDEQQRRIVIVFRVFNDGLGFRYEFPEQPNLKAFEIADELTEFALSEDSKSWWIPAFEDNRYEYIYDSTPLSEVRSVHTPYTLQRASGLCLSIHEAALVDYSSMALTNVGALTLKANLYPWSDGVKVKTAAPMKTPWRTIQIGDTPGDLVTSNLILNLNEPCQLADVSWVKPGKYVGVWWEMHVGRSTWGSGPTHGANTANVKRFIDFAAKHGFDGVLVEGWNQGWDGDWIANGPKFSFTQPYPDFDMKELSRYSADRDVYLVGHHETAGAIANYESQLEDAYRYYQQHGVKAVKSGYVDYRDGVDRIDANGQRHGEWHHGQFMVRHYQHAAEQAAKHKIMLVAHEPIKDTGLRRTWPNMLSREGARGQEYNAWASDGGNPPSHTVILPFTRMLSGPMDFTPGVFDLKMDSGDRPDNQINTTLAKQLALYVVIYTPMQMAVDFPEVYEAHLDAFQFIRDVPTDWEETRVVNAKIGDYLTIVRKERDGEDWCLGAVTGETGRVLDAPLSFLDRGRTYVAQIYRDGDDAHWDHNPQSYVIEEQEVDANTVLRLRLAPGGGQAIRFTPKSS